MMKSCLSKYDDVEICILCDLYEDKMQRAANYIKEKCGNTPVCTTDYREVLDKNIINKKRSNLSKECYIVDSSNGRAYNIVAKDNSVATYPRYKLIPTTKGVIADTIDNEKRGIIDKIVSYDEHSDKYTVIYEGGVKDKIKSKYLRETTPTRLSNIELDFWKKQGSIPNALRKFYNN